MMIKHCAKFILFCSLTILAGCFLPLALALAASLDSPAIVRSAVEYTPAPVRDPFKSYLVKEEPKLEAVAAKPMLDLNKFKVTGIIWGGDLPQAIINDQVLAVGDLIEGAEILNIEKEGIDLGFEGQNYKLGAPGQSLPADVAK